MSHSQEFPLDKQKTECLIKLGIKAGEIALRYKKSGAFSIQIKSDGTEVTEVDLELSELIRIELSSLFPEIPVICEEGTVRSISGRTFWMVDPIDGTKSFISGIDEYAVNFALIHDGKPVFGLINAPSLDGGKMAYTRENEVIINDSAIHIPKQDQSRMRIVTSKRTTDSEVNSYLAWHAQHIHSDAEISQALSKKVSSAVKFIYLLENESDIYLSFVKTMEWDIAAGHALVRTLGGKIKTMHLLQNQRSECLSETTDYSINIGDNMLYNKPGFVNSPFISFIKNPWKTLSK